MIIGKKIRDVQNICTGPHCSMSAVEYMYKRCINKQRGTFGQGAALSLRSLQISEFNFFIAGKPSLQYCFSFNKTY